MEFIDGQQQLIETFEPAFNTTLIVLSVFIAITSSFTAFGVTERIEKAEIKTLKIVWIIFGAVSMGLGLWAMHFIGSLALSLPIPVSYNTGLTLISMLPAILVSSVVLWLMMQKKFDFMRLLICGVLMGLGISTMHFIGTMAMELNAQIYYVKDLFIAAVIIAVSLATIALYLQFHAMERSEPHVVGLRQVKSAMVMGFAVAGMYYLIMQATIFVPTEHGGLHRQGIDTHTLGYIVSTVIFLILLLAIITPLTLRYRQMSIELKLQEVSLSIAATSFQTHEAIMIMNADKEIIRVNNAFTDITGFAEDEVLGKKPGFLGSGKHNDLFFEEIWKQVEAQDKWHGEIWNRRKNGEVFPEWETVSAVKDKSGSISHYVSVFSDITIYKNSERKIEQLAFYDPLTNLPNRRLLNERLTHELAVAKRYKRVGALLFLDLDQFKLINDSLGHSVGDGILVESARRLTGIIRKSDTAARLGGDEFVVLVSAEDRSTKELMSQAQSVAEKILGEINKPFYEDKQELFISPSIGISLYTGIDESLDMILKQADTAMYQAKEKGRNMFMFYQESMQKAADERLTMEKNLRKAIKNKELMVYYQPQLAQNGEIVGAEALLRWAHPEKGIIAAAEIIPVAEETGLIINISLWILQQACQQLIIMDEKGIILPAMAINISPKQFHQSDFVDEISRVVKIAGVENNRIVLEIPERIFLKNIDEAVEKINRLKQCGFKLSIDDFGTGYSSLTYLKKLPFDQIKIDQTFVLDLLHSANDAAIVKAIIMMANGLGLDLIAEGVETEEHLDYLYSYGCSHYQGFYFSKPLPADEFRDFFFKHCIAQVMP